MKKSQAAVVVATLATLAMVLFLQFAWGTVHDMLTYKAPAPTAADWAFGLPEVQSRAPYLDPLTETVPGIIIPLLLLGAAAFIFLGAGFTMPSREASEPESVEEPETEPVAPYLGQYVPDKDSQLRA